MESQLTRPDNDRRWLRLALLVALTYAVVGVATADFTKAAHSAQWRTLWRLAAWVLSLITVAGHLIHERIRVGNTTKVAALHVATAVAIGAFVLAIAGPIVSHWSMPDFRRTAFLSLVLWPVVTGIPAFLAALVAGSVLGRLAGRERSANRD